MADINITKIEVSDDTVTVTGTVDGKETTANIWLSHLYPPSTQDKTSAARGCQTDDDRKNHLFDVLLASAGRNPKQELATKVSDALAVLISKPDKPPVVIDPTVAAVK